MILPAAAAPQADATVRAEVCIVGGGPAGITLALALGAAGRDVLLLESGGLTADEAVNVLNAGEVADPALHSPADKYRVRCLGGGTSIWGGRCMPFDPIDFEAREWVPHSGWPIGFEEVARFYPEANALCEAGEYEYDARLAVPDGMRPVLRGFTPAHFEVNGIERFSCPTDFGQRYRDRLSRMKTVRVLPRATVTRLVAEDSRIAALEVRDAEDRPFRVQADVVVLAAGGIETARLLLVSNDVHAAGIGNTADLVGRFYMSHVAGTIGELRLDVPADAVWHGYDVAWDGTYCRRRLALRAEVQRRLGVGNVIYRLHHPRIADPAHGTGPLSAIFLGQRFISYEYAKRLVSDEPAGAGLWLRHGVNAMRDAGSTARFLAHWLRHRTLAARKFPSVIIRPRKRLFSLDFHAEQVPNPASRVTLGAGLDRFGNRQVRIDWRYSPQDVETVAQSFALLRDDLAAQRMGRLALAPNERDFDSVVRRDGAYGGHHIGTARMGASAAGGVVDRNGKVFGINNLFLAGSAVFPTSSQANPTLTIVAMALRLAAHLRVVSERVTSAMAQEPAGAQ